MSSNGRPTSHEIHKRRQIVLLDILTDDVNLIAELAGKLTYSRGPDGPNEGDITYAARIVCLAKILARRMRARARRQARKKEAT